MMSDSKSNPSLPVVCEGEQFVSAEAFASANSSGDWDALAPRSGTPSNGQQHNQHFGLSRLERDSLYTKFDPLLSIKKEEGVASDEARLSSVFKVPLLVGSGGTEAGENMKMESMTSPRLDSASSYKSASQQADKSLSTSQLLTEEDSTTRPNASDQSWDAERRVYISAEDMECSFHHENLNGTVIPGNSSILEEACKSNGGEMGSPDASHDSTAVAAPNQGDCNTSVFSESFLGKFNSVLVVTTPPVVKTVRFAVVEEQEIDLNGSITVSPPSPLDSLDVTQILVEVGDDENAVAEKSTPLAPCEENGLDETVTPVINISFVEEDHVSNSASSSSLEPTLEFQDNQIAALSTNHQEQLLRIQELKASLAQMDQEYIEFCESSKEMLSEKEGKLHTLLKLEEKEMGELGRIEARNVQLKLEKYQTLEDLKLREAEFADMLRMYEQIKDVATLIQRNTVTLNERNVSLDKSLDDKEERDAAAMKMVKDTLDTMQADFLKKFKYLEAENIKLKARIRMIDMTTEQQMAKINQLDKESEQLKMLCDELVTSK